MEEEGEYVCVTCVAAITKSRGWLPGNAFQPPHTHTTLDQPQNPLASFPSYPSFLHLMAHSSFLGYSARRLPSMAHCSTFSTLILIPSILPTTFELVPGLTRGISRFRRRFIASFEIFPLSKVIREASFVGRVSNREHEE